jgi:hypothetical protein
LFLTEPSASGPCHGNQLDAPSDKNPSTITNREKPFGIALEKIWRSKGKGRGPQPERIDMDPRYLESIRLYQKAVIENAKISKTKLQSVGRIYLKLARHSDPSYLQEALTIAERIQDHSLQAQVYLEYSKITTDPQDKLMYWRAVLDLSKASLDRQCLNKLRQDVAQPLQELGSKNSNPDTIEIICLLQKVKEALGIIPAHQIGIRIPFPALPQAGQPPEPLAPPQPPKALGA